MFILDKTFIWNLYVNYPEKDKRKTLTNTIFIGDSDLNGAGWFGSLSHIGHNSGSPAFQPFMPIEIFPDSSEPCENADGQK